MTVLSIQHWYLVTVLAVSMFQKKTIAKINDLKTVFGSTISLTHIAFPWVKVVLNVLYTTNDCVLLMSCHTYPPQEVSLYTVSRNRSVYLRSHTHKWHGRGTSQPDDDDVNLSRYIPLVSVNHSLLDGFKPVDPFDGFIAYCRVKAWL